MNEGETQEVELTHFNYRPCMCCFPRQRKTEETKTQ